MKIGIAGKNGKELSVETPREENRTNLICGSLSLTIGIFATVIIVFIDTPIDEIQGMYKVFAFLLMALSAMMILIGAGWILRSHFRKLDELLPIPDRTLLSITEFLKENDALDVLEEHVREHGRLEWGNLQELSAYVARKMLAAQSQQENGAIREAKILTGNQVAN